MKVLVTGGLGYIGSHTVIELLEKGYAVTVVDNLDNSHLSTVASISSVSGRTPHFAQLDIRDEREITRLLRANSIESVLHFAAKKSPAESFKRANEYFSTNVSGTLSLLSAMEKADVKSLVFSSSAAVYGNSSPAPILECSPVDPLSPYAHSKLIGEQLLERFASLSQGWTFRVLRYFNPVGAHPSGVLGENPKATATNLFPVVMSALSGEKSNVTVFGNDFQTVDGTGVRDYVHVCDIAVGHRLALESLSHKSDYERINLGTGRGYSVLEIIEGFGEVVGTTVPYRISVRRQGDPAESFADISWAEKFLSWSPRFDLRGMIQDAWNWHVQSRKACELAKGRQHKS